MKYQVGRQGRVIIAKFDDGDDILENIKSMIKKENIRSAVFFLIGGIKKGKFVVGPRNETLPPEPMWEEMDESHETFGTGTVFWETDTPRIHFHGAFAKGDKIRAGCLRENAHAYLVIEAIIIEIEGINAVRRMDPDIGMPLLDIN